MNYSFNIKGDEFVKAQSYDVNASYKDLGAVCDAIRHLRASDAVAALEQFAEKESPVHYRRHNRHMGSRHELGGRKGGYPEKAASEVLKTLVNAIANAGNKGKDADSMFVVSASANKTRIERRYPSKGSIAWGRGMYGMSATNHSDIEYAKIEIVLAEEGSGKLTKNMKYFIKRKNKPVQKLAQKTAQKKAPAKQQPKQAAQAEKQKPKQPEPEPAKKEEVEVAKKS
jgi:large subunit ribosomal protein L22